MEMAAFTACPSIQTLVLAKLLRFLARVQQLGVPHQKRRSQGNYVVAVSWKHSEEAMIVVTFSWEAQRRSNDLSFSSLRLPVEEVAMLRSPYAGMWRPLCEVFAGAALAARSTARGRVFCREPHDLDSVKTFALNVGALYGISNAWGKHPLVGSACSLLTNSVKSAARYRPRCSGSGDAPVDDLSPWYSIRDLVDALTVKTVTIMLLTNGVRLLGTMQCSDPGGPATTLSRPAWMWTKRGMGRSSMFFCPDWCNSGFSR